MAVKWGQSEGLKWGQGVGVKWGQTGVTPTKELIVEMTPNAIEVRLANH